MTACGAHGDGSLCFTESALLNIISAMFASLFVGVDDLGDP